MGIADSLGRAFSLPAEAVTDLAVVRAVGGMEVTIENHKGIISYTPEEARVRVKGGSLSVRGVSLVISAFRANSMIITGNVKSVEFGG